MFCEGMEESRPKRWCSVFKMLAWELTCKLWMWKPKETNTVKQKKPRNKKKPHVNWESRWMPYDTLRVLSEFLKSSGACQRPYPGLTAHQLWWWRTRQRVQGSNSNTHYCVTGAHASTKKWLIVWNWDWTGHWFLVFLISSRIPGFPRAQRAASEPGNTKAKLWKPNL